MTSNDTSARWTNVVAASAFGGLATVVALRRWLVPPQQDESTQGVGEPLACFGPGGPYHRCIYLDWNATSPIFPEVTAAMEPFTSAHWGNPSSSHVFAATCRKALARARSNVAEMLGPGTSAEEVLFCSCGSEADNHAIRAAIAFGAAYLGKDVKPHIITSVIEHPAILQYLRALHAEGRIEEPSLLPVDGFGFVDPQKVRDALRENTVLVTIMHSNNEIGTIQPIQHIVHTVKAYNETRPSGHRVLVHTDAAQSCGKVQVHVNDLGVDFATVVGHKFGAPKGCAALYVRSSNFRPDDGVDNDLPEFPSLIYGGGQESGRRAGTENVLLAVALGAAARLAVDQLAATKAHLQKMRNLLRTKLIRRFSGTATSKPLYRINGPSDDSFGLPNTLSIGFRGILSHQAIDALKDRVAFSAGSACHSGRLAVSAVLTACSVPDEFARGTLRLSVGRHTTHADVVQAAQLIGDKLEKLMRQTDDESLQ